MTKNTRSTTIALTPSHFAAGELVQSTLERTFACERTEAPKGIKDGPAFIPAIFHTPRRRNVNVEAITALVLDFDHLSDEATGRTTEKLEETAFAFWIYETFSHRPPDNCFRVIFPFDLPFSAPGDWPRLRGTLLCHLGVATETDPACSDCSRLYYLPRCPSGETREIEFRPGAYLDWRPYFIVSTPLVVLTERPVPEREESRPVALEQVREGLLRPGGQLGVVCKRLVRGEALTPPPAQRAPDEPARYLAWRMATAHLANLLEGWENSAPIIEQLLRPSHAAEIMASPQDYTSFETIVTLFESARSSAPAYKARRENELEALRTRLLEARAGSAASHASGEDLPDIELGPDESATVDRAEDVIAGDPAIYQRAGHLVHVRRHLSRPKFLRRPAGAPEIANVARPTCREALSRGARWWNLDGRKKELVQKRPPDWVADDLLARGEWKDIRSLVGIVEAPMLRPDGTILSTPGYDTETGLLFEATSPVLPIPDSPTYADALNARDFLLEVVVDFPFVSAAHQSAWLAAVLTWFARFAIQGHVPLVLFEAPAAGTGKTLLADTIGMICAGRELAKMANTLDDAEMRKRLLVIALSGDGIVTFDNVRGGFGTPALDMALTAGTIRERILGASEEKTVALDAIFFASGNNVELLGDIRRRILHCRMDAGEERPEERENFKHPDLLRWLAEERGRLVAASLTILRAYHLSGCPVVGKVKPWGSFEAWQALVCGAIRWLGLAAPEDTRADLVEAESEPEKLGSLLRAWQAVQPGGGMTASGALVRAAASGGEELRDALAATCPAKGGGSPTASSVGYGLRRYRHRLIGGLRFMQTKSGDRFWCVEAVSANRGPSRSSGERSHGQGSAASGVNDSIPPPSTVTLDSGAMASRADVQSSAFPASGNETGSGSSLADERKWSSAAYTSRSGGRTNG